LNSDEDRLEGFLHLGKRLSFGGQNSRCERCIADKMGSLLDLKAENVAPRDQTIYWPVPAIP